MTYKEVVKGDQEMTDINIKAKEPWIAVMLNLIFPGIGQLYAGRKARGLAIIGIVLLLEIVGLIALRVLTIPEVTITPGLIIIVICLFAISFLFIIFILFDGHAVVKKSNMAAGVKPVKATTRVLAVAGCAFLLFVVSPLEVIGTHIQNNYLGVKAFKIPTGAMKPTLIPGDRILVDKKAYEQSKPQRLDVIVFKYPEDKAKFFIMRLIGLPGETLEIKNGKVLVDGKAIQRNTTYYNKPETKYGEVGKKIRVPANSYYVLGDNSASSRDSRYWGFVPKNDILGKATKIYWTLSRSSKIE
ncbi:signal peptidase I [Candidatus Omnitrophota bacterium]